MFEGANHSSETTWPNQIFLEVGKVYESNGNRRELVSEFVFKGQRLISYRCEQGSDRFMLRRAFLQWISNGKNKIVE